MNNLPGIKTYTKETRSDPATHAIDMLRTLGADTSWYDKHRTAATPSYDNPQKCTWFTIYILDGDAAYTKTQTGDKYQEFRKLAKAVEIPAYYCQHCKGRWPGYDEAVAHLTVTT